MIRRKSRFRATPPAANHFALQGVPIDAGCGIKRRIFQVSCCLSLLLSAGMTGGCGLVRDVVRSALPLAAVKFRFSCIPEHTLIDTPRGSRPIEELKPGNLVVGYAGQPVKILQKHAYLEDQEAVFLRIEFEDGAEIDLCEKHRVAGVPAGSLHIGQRLEQRVVKKITCHRGVCRSYDLLTEDEGYRIQGVPVNSMIEEMYAAGLQAGTS
jgi:hypothetical protein